MQEDPRPVVLLATLHTKVAMDLHERLGTALTSACDSCE
jgi:hypothetical protein